MAAAIRPRVRRVRNERLIPSEAAGRGRLVGRRGERLGNVRDGEPVVGRTIRPVDAAARRRRRRSAPAATRARRLRRRHQPVADAADRLEVGRLVRVDLDLLAQAPHRDPDVRRVGVLGVGPAAGEQRLGRDGLAEVRGERVEQARLGRRQLDRLAADGRLAAVELEGQVRPEDEALARDLVAEPAQDPVDPGPQLRVVVGLGDVVLGDLLEEVRLGVAGVDRGQDDDRQVRPAP